MTLKISAVGSGGEGIYHENRSLQVQHLKPWWQPWKPNQFSSHESQTHFLPKVHFPLWSLWAPIWMLHGATIPLGHFLYLGALNAFLSHVHNNGKIYSFSTLPFQRKWIHWSQGALSITVQLWTFMCVAVHIKSAPQKQIHWSYWLTVLHSVSPGVVGMGFLQLK